MVYNRCQPNESDAERTPVREVDVSPAVEGRGGAGRRYCFFIAPSICAARTR